MTTTVCSSFGDWAEMWLKYQCIGLTNDYQKAIQSQVHYLVEYIGEKPVTDVRPFDIEHIISDLGVCNPHTKKPTAKKTLRDLRNTARNIFDFIMDNSDLIIKNPARKIRIPKNAPQGKRRALTKQEIQWVIHTEHRCRLAALIMTFCGLRAGELIPLNWTDIDFEQSVVNIYKSVTKTDGNSYRIKTGTKNGKSRTVAIPKEVLDEIKACYKVSSSPYISSQLDGSLHTPTSWSSMWTSYNTTLSHLYASNKQAGQSIYDPKGVKKRIERITPHIFRHTFATMLYTSGVDVLSAQKLLGHSHVTTTLEIYTHLDEMKYNISFS